MQNKGIIGYDLCVVLKGDYMVQTTEFKFNFGQIGKYRIKYEGSIFWPIFWTVLFFPIAIMLFLTGAHVAADGVTYRLKYDGSRFWLGFWILVFFPVAIFLLLANGCAWVIEKDLGS